MSTALTILLLTIATGPGEDRLTNAIGSATRRALGADAQVVSRPLGTFPTDAQAMILGAEAHADAVAEVSWSTPDYLRATIRLERSSSKQWLEREIGFRAVDDPLERSRTVALTIISMLPEQFVLEHQQQATPPPSLVEPVAEVSYRAPPLAEPTQPGGLRHASALSGVAIAAFGVGDYGGGVGGALDFRHQLAPSLFYRIGAGARVGQDLPAQAVTRFFYGAAGLAWNAWTDARARGALGLRMDALVTVAEFGHFSADDVTTDYERKWMPGGDLLAESCYFFSSGAAVVLAAGGEVVFGKTDIFVGGRKVTTFEFLHPVVELGLRAGF